MKHELNNEKYLHFSDEPIWKNEKIVGYALVSEEAEDQSKLTAFDRLMQPENHSYR